MRFVFIVQGEGRGHLTQAIALREMLVKNGHEVAGVLVGKSNRREIPSFFSDSIKAPVFHFESPNFLPVSKSKKPDIPISVAYNVCKIAYYVRSIFFIRKKIKELQPDVVINFYELLAGLTYLLFPLSVPYVCIAHQYLFLHPEFQFPPAAHKYELSMLKFFTWFTCVRAKKLLALSMRKMEDCRSNRKFVAVPPLLRQDVLNSSSSAGDYLHGYLLNETYSDEIIQFHETNPEVKMHFFWDKKGVEETTKVHENLSFHTLNDKLFINYMKGCRAYATTAGFESVCEAMYFGKPALMVPTHIEQECNAFDAQLAGAGIVSDSFDLRKLLDFLPQHSPKAEFRDWVHQAEEVILKELQSVL